MMSMHENINGHMLVHMLPHMSLYIVNPVCQVQVRYMHATVLARQCITMATCMQQ